MDWMEQEKECGYCRLSYVVIDGWGWTKSSVSKLRLKRLFN
jgi:hypothetical protein